ncbi:MAG: tRNA (guanosine(37)-N1)-methyltransferase TrmD [Mycoplasmataceae bacterium]|jgi:tRNA (guanine37-N1)-methyltransferase|nr:tRNA (guanosine(37)-N1)-methyltransferase TrmD [Mycoplasmataceae bacterium]
MRITILTLFPELFNNFLKTSIIKQNITDKVVDIEVVNFRSFSKDKRQRVDDTPYGGGGGMVLCLQPIVDAIRFYKQPSTKVVLLSPQGKIFNQACAKKLSKCQHLIIICGRYEGFDERILNYVDQVISIGDYVLNGGEIPAMLIAETIIRLLPNAISKESLISESFNDNLLDHSVYTKPAKFEGHEVPSILLSGNHKKIDEFRHNEKINKTKQIRPDLFKKYKKQK